MPAIWIPKRLVELSLINTAGETECSFITQCEEEYTQRIDIAAQEIIKENKPIIMLTGPSASGKTTTAYKIKECLEKQGKAAQVISLDNFFKNKNDYPRFEDGTKDYENVTAIELDLFKACINNLLKDGVAKFPEFDFKVEERIENAVEVKLDNGFLIIEGIHALNPLLLNLIENDKVFTIYAGLREEYSHSGQRILSTRQIRMIRRMIRDYKHRSHSMGQTVDMWDKVCSGEDKYIKVFKPNANLLLDTSFSYEVLIINDILQSFKEQNKADILTHKALQEIFKTFENINFLQLKNLPKSSMLVEFYG